MWRALIGSINGSPPYSTTAEMFQWKYMRARRAEECSPSHRSPWTPARPPPQIAYVLTTNDGTKLAVNVLAFENTISWQFRYEPVLGHLPATDGSARHGLAHRSVARRARPASLAAV